MSWQYNKPWSIRRFAIVWKWMRFADSAKWLSTNPHGFRKRLSNLENRWGHDDFMNFYVLVERRSVRSTQNNSETTVSHLLLLVWSNIKAIFVTDFNMANVKAIYDSLHRFWGASRCRCQSQDSKMRVVCHHISYDLSICIIPCSSMGLVYVHYHLFVLKAKS